MQKNIAIIDIDGTVAKIGSRIELLKQTPKNWDLFYADCFQDEPIKNMIELVKTLSLNYDIVFCTGRRDSVRGLTQIWIEKHFGQLFNYRNLLMRKSNDKRSDTEVKPELLETHGYTIDNVAFIIEDRSKMVDKWRELGFTCLQCDKGEF